MVVNKNVKSQGRERVDFMKIHVGISGRGLIKGFTHPPQYYRQPEMFAQILHYMNTALTGLFAIEVVLKIYAYGFRVRSGSRHRLGEKIKIVHSGPTCSKKSTLRIVLLRFRKLENGNC